MKTSKLRLLLLSLGLLGCLGLALIVLSPRTYVEVQPRDSKWSPDRRWIAVVQLEVRNTAWGVSDAVYAVRLKKAEHKNAEGELVMNVPVNYPDPEPLIGWQGGTLVVTLLPKESYQYFVNSVDGVAVVLERSGHIENSTGTAP